MTKKSKASTSLSALSRASPDLVEVLSLNHFLLDDRSLAIVSGADVEKTLEGQIIRQMVKVNGEELKALFESDGAPMGTFSAKIKIGHAFGVFGSSTKGDLEIIRQIRNVFAHARKPISFYTPAVAAACERLQAPLRFPERIVLNGYDATRMRDRFFGTCGLLQYSLAFRGDPEIPDFNPHPLD